MIKLNHLLIGITLVLTGCISVNKNIVMLHFNPVSRELKVDLIASGKYLVDIKTKKNNDTLELFVYEQPVFLTIKEKQKHGFKIITIDKSINYIEHRDSLYSLSNLPISE